MSGTSLDAVLTALVAAFSTVDLPNFSVTDGPEWEPDVLSLEVGWAGEYASTAEAATVTRTQNDAEGFLFSETMLIDCLLASHDGTATTAATRKTCTDTLTLLLAALPYRLPGVWESARVADVAYIPTRVEGDTTSSLRFTVAVYALAP